MKSILYILGFLADVWISALLMRNATAHDWYTVPVVLTSSVIAAVMFVGAMASFSPNGGNHL